MTHPDLFALEPITERYNRLIIAADLIRVEREKLESAMPREGK